MFAYIHSSGPEIPHPILRSTILTDTVRSASYRDTEYGPLLRTESLSTPRIDLSRNHQPPIQPPLIGHDKRTFLSVDISHYSIQLVWNVFGRGGCSSPVISVARYFCTESSHHHHICLQACVLRTLRTYLLDSQNNQMAGWGHTRAMLCFVLCVLTPHAMTCHALTHCRILQSKQATHTQSPTTQSSSDLLPCTAKASVYSADVLVDHW